MKVQDVMSRQAVTVEPDASILHAARLMLQGGFSGLPVVTPDGALVGMVTEGDFLRRKETGTMRRRPPWLEFLMGPGHLANEYTHAAGRLVKEVMTRDVLTVTEETALDEAVSLMERNRVKRLPVLRGERLVGMITRRDLLHAFVVERGTQQPAAREDETIRDMLINELKQHAWAPAAIGVAVANGKVTLTGTIFDDRQRDAVRVVAENIPGVKSIEDRIVWIEPMSGTVVPPAAA